MKKKVLLTSVCALVFSCLVSYADVPPRHHGPEKHKTERVDKKSHKHNPKHVAHKSHKSAHIPAHKPAHKPPHKPVAHRPHKPAPKPIYHCNRPVVYRSYTGDIVAGAVTTAAVIGLIAAIVD